MRLLMVSGDRQVAVGEQGPLYVMQREFSRHFERIDVICPRPPGEVRVRTIFDRVHMHPATCGRAGMVDYIAKRGRELIDEHGHRLIVSHDYGWFYNGLGSARLSRATGVPYVSEIHHVPGHPVAADLRERLDRFIARRYVGWAKHRARAFRVVNEGQLVPLLEGWGVPRDQIAVLPSLYMDLDVFAPPPQPVEVQADVLYAGRMVNNKGLDRIVDALAQLAGEGLELRAILIGKGPLRAATEERVRRRGLEARVRFISWVPSQEDLADLYRASRVVVCASTCEGGPRFTVEAMACGTPVVSTPVGMMCELLEDGVQGATAGFDVASLADALRRVLADEAGRREMGRAARIAAERFEYHEILRGYAEGLQRIAGERP